ncbi:trypsin 5G1 [Culex quinquefasciatus]|uniref:trypsin n=1 Tax=Culex quinquefasciatus TaxID=7176 RepID=B0WBU0_CULQU|nr:trypsin 5G1 [Culex quinquefasciatus]|eukprot:XP_001846174.1 trypsin 5G1 [Culex quinquefasciatus]
MNLAILLLLIPTLLAKGHPTTIPSNRIVGGQLADISEAPFLVSVLYYGYYECAGSLLSPRWLLTAADCIYLGVRYTVRVNSSAVDQGGVLAEVQSIVVHPRYSLYDRDYNFALMELDRDVEVKFAELPGFDGVPENGAALDAFGWGGSWDSWSYELRRGSLAVMNRDECQELVWDEFVVTDRLICAGSDEGGDNLSYGDVGGPLLEGHTLLGVASYSYGDGWYIYPAIFGRVSSVLGWINSTITDGVN